MVRSLVSVTSVYLSCDLATRSIYITPGVTATRYLDELYDRRRPDYQWVVIYPMSLMYVLV